MAQSAEGCLIGIGYSPWTEKARWALDYCGVPYRYREHVILLGMPELRWKTGRWTGPLTVPAYVAKPGVFMDSWDIARFADREKGSLFPEASRERIERYNALSEKATEAARLLFSARLMEDPEGQAEALPAFIPRPLRKPLTFMARTGVWYVRKEFGFDLRETDKARSDLRDVWSELARDLRAAGGDYLVGGKFSYADIAMAVTLFAIEPPGSFQKFGPALTRCWSNPSFKSEFADLLGWRDRIYGRHRRVGG